MSTTLINGTVSSLIDVQDRGLHYGDGLFETIAVKNHKLLLWTDHLARLNEGCKILGLPVIDEQQWLEDIQKLDINNESTVVKLLLTRGAGGRGYQASDTPSVSRIVSAYPWPDYSDVSPEQGVHTIFCQTHASTNATLAGLKHINKLENVLARNEWSDPVIREGLMFDGAGHLIEGTMSNVFAVINNTLYTPLLDTSGVKGVVRNKVMTLAAQLDLTVEEVNLTAELILNMEELFITNSLIGIWPISKINSTTFNTGPVTTTLMNALDMSIGAQEF